MNSRLILACFLWRPQLLTRVKAPSIWRGISPRSFGSLRSVSRFCLEADRGMIPVAAEAATVNRSLRPAQIEGHTWWTRIIGWLTWLHVSAVRLWPHWRTV